MSRRVIYALPYILDDALDEAAITTVAQSVVAQHNAAADPHPQYLLESEYVIPVSDHALLSHLDYSNSGHTGFEAEGTAAALLPIVETRANLLALTPTENAVGFASDTLEMLFWNGSAWHVAPLELIEQANAVDIGLQFPMVQNDRAGYTAEYITDKAIYNSRILGNANATEGSVRTGSGVLQVYLNGTWADVVTGFRFREDSAGYYELEHKPIGFTWWVELSSGNSDDLGLNGLPLAQQYRVSMGAYPVHEQIVGRSITA